MRTLRNFALLFAAYCAAFYAGFCLLGGPDAAILSKSSFLFGIPFLIISVLLIFACNKLVPLRAYTFLPIVFVILAWLFSVAGFHRTGFSIWLFGTVVSCVAGLVYWASVEFSMPR